MRTTKFAALFAAVALLVVGATFATFAADPTWVPEGDEWTAYDKNDNQIFEEWASSNGGWYYIGDDGYMVRESLVDDDQYYVDANGQMVTDAWIKVEDDDYEDEENDLPAYRWFYFQPNGKAYKNTKKECPTANGTYTFIFGEDGAMLWGWIFDKPTGGAYTMDATSDADYSTGLYYAGTADEGMLYADKWLNWETNADDETYNYFYFDAATSKKAAAKPGKKVVTKTVKGVAYDFDEAGIMLTSWQTTESVLTTTANAFYGDDGSKVTKGWFQTFAPDATDEEKEDSDNLCWFYAKNKSTLARDEVVIDGGKFYVVDGKGVLCSGVVEIQWEDPSKGTIRDIDKITADELDIDDYLVYEAGTNAKNLASGSCALYYLNEEHDGTFGCMKTGAQKVDDDNTLYFTKANTIKKGMGKAYNGMSGNYFYQNGAKLTGDASENRYWVVTGLVLDVEGTGSKAKIKGVTSANNVAVKEATVTAAAADNTYVITASGSFVKSTETKGKKDSQGYTLFVKDYKLVKVTDD